MVPCNTSPTPKKPSPVFSILHGIGILCSSCFGKFGNFKRATWLTSENPRQARLDHMSDMAITAEENSLLHPHQHIAFNVRDHSHDGGIVGGTARHSDHECDDEHFGDDDDDYGRMFDGIFILGSKVLAEVELQSPVEENIGVATPLRTPQRSNPSSAASSTRQLNDGPYQASVADMEASTVNVKHWSLSGSNAVVSPTRLDSMHRSTPCLSSKVSMGLSLHHGVDQTTMLPSHVGDKAASLHVGHDYATSALLKMRHRIDPLLDESEMEDSGSPLPASVKHYLRHHTFWNDKQPQVATEPLPVCRNSEPSSESVRWIARHEEAPVGSLPGFRESKSSSEERQNKDNVKRHSRSLTDQDFAEVKGCIDLGFVSTQDHIPNLRRTLPALEVCYAVAHCASPACTSEDSKSSSPGSPPVSPWRIASPGDKPQEVKARLRHWAQAVACNVRQGS